MIFTKVTISGLTVTDIPQLNFTRSVSDNNASSTFTASLNNYAGYNSDKYSIGNEIVVYADKDIDPPTTVIFKGILEDINFQGEGVSERMELSTNPDHHGRAPDNYSLLPLYHHNKKK